MIRGDNLFYEYIDTHNLTHKTLFKSENITLGIFTLYVVLFPIFLSYIVNFPNQILIGIVVNLFLAWSALHLSLYRSLPIVFLPSTIALGSGVIFGANYSLLFLVPAIWFANALYVFLIKDLFLRNGINYFLSITVASLFKAGIILTSTALLVYLGNLPNIFLIPMGAIQLVTALAGGFIAGSSLINK